MPSQKITAAEFLESESLPAAIWMPAGGFPKSAFAAAAAAAGFAVVVFDCSCLDSKEAFMSEAAAKLEFPEYFGKNWDAFDECLSEIYEDFSTAGCLLVFDHAEQLFAGNRGQIDLLTDIISTSVEKLKAAPGGVFRLKAVFVSKGQFGGLPGYAC